MHAQESTWINAARKGDLMAFRHLVDLHKDRVYSLSIGLLKNKEDAEELSQDVFVKAHKSLKSFEGRSKFSVWLYRITYNSAMSRLQKKTLTTETLDESGFGDYLATDNRDALDQLKREERQHYLQEAMAKLADQDQVLIRLFYLEELSVAEIEKVTGLTRSNIKVRLMRSREKLHFCLKQLLSGELTSIL